TDYSDTVRVLAVLEGYATSLASQKFPAEKISRLRELNQQMREVLEDFDILGYGKLNTEFHRLICEECHNEYLLETIRDTTARMDSIRGLGSTLYSARVKESIDEHDNLIHLLENGAAPEKIEQAARYHKLRTAQDFERRRLR